MEDDWPQDVSSAMMSGQVVISPRGLKWASSRHEAPPVKLIAYVRMQLGEGIEKGADDFTAEVAKMSGTGQPDATV
jgi:translation elongation factor EF-Ts